MLSHFDSDTAVNQHNTKSQAQNITAEGAAWQALFSAFRMKSSVECQNLSFY